jgi:signal transduction histidine kinase
MLTAKDQQHDVQSGFVAGADDYLVKPLDATQLRQRLNVAERIMAYEQELEKSRGRLEHYANEMEQLAEERARQLAHADRMATLGTLAAGIAHEINNPATFISGNAQTMQQSWPEIAQLLHTADPKTMNPLTQFAIEEFPEMLKDIRKGVDRISTIVSGLKTYARQDSDTKQSFSLIEAVDDALKLCHSVMKNRVHVHNHVPNTLPSAYGNQQQIEQVLVNLFVNAAHIMIETLKTRGDLTITAEENNGHITVCVLDSGPGIPDKLLDRIFDPFYTTKKVGVGTGLGLSISRGIIEEHHGELTAANRTDQQGAAFCFTLPVATHTQE